MRSPLRYIVFEGIDGAGKSTQVSSLCDRLQTLSYTVVRLVEPTYGQYGTRIRAIMNKRQFLSIERQRELFTLDRREHVERKIKPLLAFIEENDEFLIVQDRYYLSASAYQARSEDEMHAVLSEQQGFAPRPDVVFLLDVPGEIAMERLIKAGKKGSIFEMPDLLDKVRGRYLTLAKDKSEPIQVIDASLPAEEVSQKIREYLGL
ncbi:MAG: dTMP kinase [Deltaproteobacteria bacterium]|nr:dTMP kinase [Deltaproteobacteria bacterium]